MDDLNSSLSILIWNRLGDYSVLTSHPLSPQVHRRLLEPAWLDDRDRAANLCAYQYVQVSATECHRVRQSATECHRVPPSASDYRVLFETSSRMFEKTYED
jgi:hypothetical protein